MLSIFAVAIWNKLNFKKEFKQEIVYFMLFKCFYCGFCKCMRLAIYEVIGAFVSTLSFLKILSWSLNVSIIDTARPSNKWISPIENKSGEDPQIKNGKIETKIKMHFVGEHLVVHSLSDHSWLPVINP